MRELRNWASTSNHGPERGTLYLEPKERLSPTLIAKVRIHKAELLAPLVADRIEIASSLILTCRKHGIGLRLEPNGDVVIESNGKAWRALVRELEEHVDEVAETDRGRVRREFEFR